MFKSLSRQKIALPFLAIAIAVAGAYLFDTFYGLQADLNTLRSKLTAITEYNEAQKATAGEYFRSKEDLQMRIGKGLDWIKADQIEVYWVADDLPENLRNKIGPSHLPFLAADSYRTILKVKVRGREFIIQRESGKMPVVVGQID